MALRALRLQVPHEADVACQLVETAEDPGQQLLQVFMEALCSDASIGLAVSQLQRHHHRASPSDLAYGRLLQRASAGLTQ